MSDDVRLRRCVDVAIITLVRHCGFGQISNNSMSVSDVRMTLGYYVKQMLVIGQLPTQPKTNQITTPEDVRFQRYVDVSTITLGRH